MPVCTFPRMFTIQPAIQVRVARCLFRGVGTGLATIIICGAVRDVCTMHASTHLRMHIVDAALRFSSILLFCDDRELRTQHAYKPAYVFSTKMEFRLLVSEKRIRSSVECWRSRTDPGAQIAQTIDIDNEAGWGLGGLGRSVCRSKPAVPDRSDLDPHSACCPYKWACERLSLVFDSPVLFCRIMVGFHLCTPRSCSLSGQGVTVQTIVPGDGVTFPKKGGMSCARLLSLLFT